MERLQKFIAECGYCSRRKAEELIKNGKVMVNGEIVKELGSKVSGGEDIVINGVLLKKEEKEYYLLNKPRGYLSTSSDDKGRKTVVQLINTKARIYPVGRLDYDTTGVLLLTNDGEFANKIMHPSNSIDKVYVAKVEGIFGGEAVHRMEAGVTIDGVKYVPKKVKLKKFDLVTNSSIVQIIIGEGHNHQVKNMFEAIGYPVSKLKREREGFFELNGLKSGEYRKLSKKEVQRVFSTK